MEAVDSEMCERLLVKHRADISLVNHQGRNAIMCAADKGYFDVLKTLMRHGGLPLIDEVDEEGETALMILIRKIYPNHEVPELLNKLQRCIHFLLANSANMKVKNKAGQTAKELAKVKGLQEEVDILEEEELTRKIKPLLLKDFCKRELLSHLGTSRVHQKIDTLLVPRDGQLVPLPTLFKNFLKGV